MHDESGWQCIFQKSWGNCLLEASKFGVLDAIRNEGSRDEHCSTHLHSPLSGRLGRKIMSLWVAWILEQHLLGKKKFSFGVFDKA